MLQSVSHFSFTVSDIEASVTWYRDVLGLRLVRRQRQANEYTQRMVGISDAVIDVAVFELPTTGTPDTPTLELIEYLQPMGLKQNLRTNAVGCAHLSFVVTDIAATYERLVSKQVEFRSPPVRITEGMNSGGYVCYFSDPDGITLELFQPPAT